MLEKIREFSNWFRIFFKVSIHIKEVPTTIIIPVAFKKALWFQFYDQLAYKVKKYCCLWQKSIWKIKTFYYRSLVFYLGGRNHNQLYALKWYSIQLVEDSYQELYTNTKAVSNLVLSSTINQDKFVVIVYVSILLIFWQL